MNKIKRFIKALGPGFVTGAADDDPSGIGTYSQTGAQFGFQQLWAAPFSFPFMTVVQEICGRIGMVTGMGLSGVIRKHYTKKMLYGAVVLLFFANTVNIGANLGAMAAAIRLLIDFPFALVLLLMTLITIILEVFVPYPAYARFLKYLTFSLFAYIITAFFVKIEWQTVFLSTIQPSFSLSQGYLLNIVAILGTTISPYLFFWQADQEVEEEISEHKIRAMGKGIPRITKKDIRNMRLDTIVGMFFSNLVMFFIIVTTASTLHAHGLTSIQTSDQAALALRPLAGNYAFLLFSMGIIGTGLLSVPILAGSASYALAETFNWRAGLNQKFARAHAFYIVIALATMGGLLVNLTPVEPFQLLYYTAVVNGILAPPLMIMIMVIANNKTIMGSHTNSFFSNFVGWLITGIMTIAAIALIVSLLLS